jgi:hypothetical protein
MPLPTTYLISDEAFSFFTNPELVQFIMFHGFAVEEFGRAIVHLCFNNYKLSKEVSKLLLRNIVNNDYDKIKDFLTMVG